MQIKLGRGRGAEQLSVSDVDTIIRLVDVILGTEQDNLNIDEGKCMCQHSNTTGEQTDDEDASMTGQRK